MNLKLNKAFPSINQSWGIAGITIAAMILFTPIYIGLNRPEWHDIGMLIYYVLAMGLPFLYAHKMRKERNNIDSFDFNLTNWKAIALVIVGIIAIQFAIISPIIGLIPMSEFIIQMAEQLSKLNPLVGFVMLVIAAPILEELIFRGVILDGLLQNYSPRKSIFISSLLFGIVHLNPWQFIAAFFIGIFSGWVYYKTRKLSLSIIIHMTNNFLGFVSMQIEGGDINPDQSYFEPFGGVAYFFLIVIVGLAITIFSVYLLNKEFVKIKAPDWANIYKNSLPERPIIKEN